jgi:2,3-bisphosphoglycerate-independent phosphoglycerate mutase
MNDKFDRKSPLVKAILDAYHSGEEDEALEPIIKVTPGGKPVGRMQNGDYVIFYDIRGEREIQITESLIQSDFNAFPVKPATRLNFVTMIEYSSDLEAQVAFPPLGRIENTLSEVVTRAGLSLCKIAESEKAVHVGYFMNGKNEKAFAGEERIVVPSPEGIASFALKPEMSACLVREKICDKLSGSDCPLLIANMANVDVVGHIEDREAVIRAVEAVDEELGRVVEACRSQGVTLAVTADHGTVEEWLYPDGQVNTGHTKNAVPFVLLDFASSKPRHQALRSEGELADVAPTLLDLLGLATPPEMSAESLLVEKETGPNGKRRILLLILDGWGLREEGAGNLIREAYTPNFDRIWSEFPHAELQASGEAVGMPADTVGNSESGHLHLGAGRRILLDRVRIDKAIEEGTFFQNPAFLWAMENARKERKALHLLGIVSHYSSHGTIDHLFALLKMAKQQNLEKVYVHSLIGRRGEKPESGAVYLDKVEQMCRSLGVGEVVTVMGRFWALDREFNWDRVEKAYRALVYGEGTPAA